MAGHGSPEHRTFDASGLRLGIVATRWHADLVDHLVARAESAAAEHGLAEVSVVRVAGSVELPVVAQALARQFDAVVALGVVVRGATAHFDYVCKSVTEGLTRVALDESTPVAHGVLTVDSDAQARDRAGFADSSEDKGGDCVSAALDAAVTLRAITGSHDRADPHP